MLIVIIKMISSDQSQDRADFFSRLPPSWQELNSVVDMENESHSDQIRKLTENAFQCKQLVVGPIPTNVSRSQAFFYTPLILLPILQLFQITQPISSTDQFIHLLYRLNDDDSRLELANTMVRIRFSPLVFQVATDVYSFLRAILHLPPRSYSDSVLLSFHNSYLLPKLRQIHAHIQE